MYYVNERVREKWFGKKVDITPEPETLEVETI
jgi:hypothetical protein